MSEPNNQNTDNTQQTEDSLTQIRDNHINDSVFDYSNSVDPCVYTLKPQRKGEAQHVEDTCQTANSGSCSPRTANPEIAHTSVELKGARSQNKIQAKAVQRQAVSSKQQKLKPYEGESAQASSCEVTGEEKNRRGRKYAYSTRNAPYILRPVAEFLILKTNRKPAALSEDEIKSLRVLNAFHTPARVMAEIMKAFERFQRNNKPLDSLTFCYIEASMRNQKATLKSKKGQAVTSREVSQIHRISELLKPSATLDYTPEEQESLNEELQRLNARLLHKSA